MTRWTRVASAGAAVALVTSLIPMFATARHAVVADANDANGVLDIRRVEMVSARTRWKVISWRRWTAEAMWDRGFTLVYLDTFGGSRADYYVRVGSNGRRISGVLYRDAERGKDRRIRSVRVRHPSGKVVTVTVPLSKVTRRDSGVYGWYVLTLFSGVKCRRVCIDRAPDSGAVTEPGPQPTPSVPSPTITPTVTPTPTPTAGR